VIEIWSDSFARGLVVANAVATLFMTGLIWFVQIVHYPLLARVAASESTAIADDHQRRTARVVAIPMLVEGLTTLGLLADRPNEVEAVWPWIGAVLLAVALGSTIALSVPLHARMSRGFDPRTGPRLVGTNWPRTVAWSLRAVVVVIMVSS
jgi:hypothetical protein